MMDFREVLARIEQTLTIPAAEYVPAIGDVFAVIAEARKQLECERARAAAPAGEVPGLRRYLADVMADGAPSEQSVARVALHLLGAALAEAAPPTQQQGDSDG